MVGLGGPWFIAGCWPVFPLRYLPHSPSNVEFTARQLVLHSKQGLYHGGDIALQDILIAEPIILITTPYVSALVYKLSKRALKIVPLSKHCAED